MTSSMFLFAALVLCALPSALGAVWCWECTPNATHWCNMTDQYMMKICTNDNSDCYMATVMVASETTYTLGCLEMQTCEQQNSTICSANQMASMCNTECTTGNGTNNPMAMNPTPTMTMTTMMTASVTTTPATTTAKTPTDAAEKLCPTFLGVLFIILFTILRQ